MNQQILFSSADQSQQTFENFYPAENQNLVDAIKSLLSSKEFGCLYLYGQNGSGKTHLLNAICHLANDAQYFDFERQTTRIDKLVNLEFPQLLVLDNLQNIDAQQSTLMLIYETLKQNSGKLFIASTLPPKALNLTLNDLESRLLAGQVFELKILNDQEKAKALKYRAGLRGFELSDEVLTYIINRYPRDFKTLFGLLDKFDDASLSSQRRVTVPFIKQLEE